MKRHTCWLIIGLCILLGSLGIVLTPTPSWALSGFRSLLVFADTNGTSPTTLEIVLLLELEDGDLTPPQGLAALEVTDPNGTVHDLLNSQVNATATYFPPDGFVLFVSFPDGNGDGLPDIPTGEYVARVQTTAGAEFFASKMLRSVTRLNIPTRLAPAANAQVTTTPTFEWQTVPGGVAYRVRIFRARQSFTDPVVSPTAPRLSIDDATVFDSPDLASTSFTLPPGVLSPGRAYYWDVRVIDALVLAEADNRTRNDGRDARSAFSVLGPYADIRRALSVVNIGDRQRATIRMANTTTTDVEVRVRAWLGLPTGEIRPLGRPGVTGLQTIGAGVVRDLPLWEKRFRATDPVGTYAIGVQLLDPTTGHRIGDEDVGQFVFTGQ
jgi:hypothetical protein